MDISLETTSLDKLRTGVLVVGAFADGALPPSARAIDEASKGKLSAVIKRGDLDAKAGSALLLHDLPGIAAERVLMVSLGKRDDAGDKSFRDALSSAARALARGAAREAALAITDLEPPGRSLAWRVQQASRVLADGAHRFDVPGVAGKAAMERVASRISLLIADEDKSDPELERAVRRGRAVAEGMALAKDLGNLGANICTPVYL